MGLLLVLAGVGRACERFSLALKLAKGLCRAANRMFHGTMPQGRDRDEAKFSEVITCWRHQGNLVSVLDIVLLKNTQLAIKRPARDSGACEI